MSDCEKSNIQDKRSLNNLKDAHSPYLLQHADNPVNWYPWCDEAFNKAREEDKPVFLSIGYSTCHWCHVMEHESFEDSEVARLMNETFVSIKVDREERPDIDTIYMKVCQMVTGSGGWPLTIIMTPEKKPFFAGTYFPKYSLYGRIGVIDLTLRVRELWGNNRNDLLQSAKELTTHLQERESVSGGEQPGVEMLHAAYTRLEALFDPQNAGFGNAPKFPTPHSLRFLLRHWKHSDSISSLQMVEQTLRHMRYGGIYDQIGFGFHRYATDSKWLVPHFEKMLYDQALISMVYIEAYQATDDLFYRKVADEIFTYVFNDMTSEDGAFYSAEDADSEGVEGKYYLYSKQEIEKILDRGDIPFALDVFGIKEDGNYNVETTGHKNGLNILHMDELKDKLAQRFGLTQKQFDAKLEKVRAVLLEHRKQRIRPAKDDKILTDWNGLMIASLAKAAKAFDEPLYAQMAQQCLDFILKNMRDKKGRLLHRYRNGHAGIQAHLDDYAFLMWGIFELYQYSFDPNLLTLLINIQNDMLVHFWDDKNSGFFMTSHDAEELLARSKEIYDGSIPSGNSVAFQNLMRLSALTGDPSYEAKAHKMAALFTPEISKQPLGYTEFLIGINYLLHERYDVIVVGDITQEQARSLLRTIWKSFIPGNIMILKPDNMAIFAKHQDLITYLDSYKTIDGNATFYVCKNKQCSAPTDDPHEILRLLGISQ